MLPRYLLLRWKTGLSLVKFDSPYPREKFTDLKNTRGRIVLLK